MLYYGETEQGTTDFLFSLCKHINTSGIFGDDTKIREREKLLSNRTEKNSFIDELVRGINMQNKKDGSSSPVLPERPRSSPFQTIEKRLRNHIKEVLSEVGPNWWVSCVPPDVKEVLERKGKGKNFDELWEFIDLGSLIKVIEDSSNWKRIFEERFIGQHPIFSDKTRVIQTLGFFKNIRDSQSHGREISKYESEFGEAAIGVIKEYLESQSADEEDSDTTDD